MNRTIQSVSLTVFLLGATFAQSATAQTLQQQNAPNSAVKKADPVKKGVTKASAKNSVKDQPTAPAFHCQIVPKKAAELNSLRGTPTVSFKMSGKELKKENNTEHNATVDYIKLLNVRSVVYKKGKIRLMFKNPQLRGNVKTVTVVKSSGDSSTNLRTGPIDLFAVSSSKKAEALDTVRQLVRSTYLCNNRDAPF